LPAGGVAAQGDPPVRPAGHADPADRVEVQLRCLRGLGELDDGVAEQVFDVLGAVLAEHAEQVAPEHLDVATGELGR
jgi:hypothetical protein